MIIKKIEATFPYKKVNMPENGEFGSGMNIIYSNKNNRSKTTVMRGIIRAFFSKSVVLPKSNPEIGELQSITLWIKNNNKDFECIYNLQTDEMTIKSEGSVSVLKDKNEILRIIFNDKKIPNSDEVRASIFGSLLLLDQDREWNDRSLFPSLWNFEKYKINLARLWMYSGSVINFSTFDDISDFVKKELKKVENQIAILKQNEGASITENASYDIEQIAKYQNEAKQQRKLYRNLTQELTSLKSKQFIIQLMTKSQNKFSSDEKEVYIIAKNMSDENVVVKATLDRLLNFSYEPIEEISKNAIEELKILDEKIITIEKQMEDSSKFIEKFKKATSPRLFDYSELVSRKEDLEKQLLTALSNKKEFELQHTQNKKEINDMELVLSKDQDDIQKNFVPFLSDSGSDLFVLKIARYLAFAKNIKAFNFPLLFDSIKEKDFSLSNQEILLKYIDAISFANQKQVFVTLTSPDKKVLDKYQKNTYCIAEN